MGCDGRHSSLGRLLRWREFQEAIAKAHRQQRDTAWARAQHLATDAHDVASRRQAERRELQGRRLLDPQVMREAAAIESRALDVNDDATQALAAAECQADLARERHWGSREASRVVASRAARMEAEALERLEKANFDQVSALLATKGKQR